MVYVLEYQSIARVDLCGRLEGAVRSARSSSNNRDSFDVVVSSTFNFCSFSGREEGWQCLASVGFDFGLFLLLD
jgi:hypothetical protein